MPEKNKKRKQGEEQKMQIPKKQTKNDKKAAEGNEFHDN